MQQRLAVQAKDGNATKRAGGQSTSLKWVVIRPRSLDGEAIVVVINENYLKQARDAEPEKIIYMFSELVEFDRCRMSWAAFKKVHLVKKAFDGTIVTWDSPVGRRLRRKGLWE